MKQSKVIATTHNLRSNPNLTELCCVSPLQLQQDSDGVWEFGEQRFASRHSLPDPLPVVNSVAKSAAAQTPHIGGRVELKYC